ncbi:MAG: cytoplasmic protein [Candidatus Eremiobacteraeota bacterium]|nr:cytoplasmic protein [Candidatus Eremiobacteraeota bacterium]MBV9648225.1 cytoplasmic protein [Candidatus Eremiobacteraeota bacterium]
MRFVSEPIEPGKELAVAALDSGEPPLPRRFRWREREIVIATVKRTWRSNKVDRGDAYLARHWFEIATTDGETAVIYFDRKARRGAPRWWLYTISSG